VCVALWIAPTLIAGIAKGWQSNVQRRIVFQQAAVSQFGGAYAVLHTSRNKHLSAFAMPRLALAQSTTHAHGYNAYRTRPIGPMCRRRFLFVANYRCLQLTTSLDRTLNLFFPKRPPKNPIKPRLKTIIGNGLEKIDRDECERAEPTSVRCGAPFEPMRMTCMTMAVDGGF